MDRWRIAGRTEGRTEGRKASPAVAGPLAGAWKVGRSFARPTFGSREEKVKRKATSRRRATARTSPLLRPIDWLSSQSTDALLFQASQLDAAAETTKRKGGGRWNADELGPGGSCEAGYPPQYYSYVARAGPKNAPTRCNICLRNAEYQPSPPLARSAPIPHRRSRWSTTVMGGVRIELWLGF